MKLDTRTASLIAVGASVSANCLPCSEINVTRPLKCGAGMQDVADAVDLGRRGRKSAASKTEASPPR